ncbi:MAG: Cys-tRNA(Pro) deacylase [Clostridia bacterium]|nr:Cys-tRNA(Pro) deacylase [Clostridia bacterium]
MDEKTNVMRLLDGKRIKYTAHCYLDSGAVSGADVAAALGQEPGKVFKTLVTVSKAKKYYVFMVPVCGELNLKKAAAAVREKSIAMIPQKELLPLTGYIHGGCSPIGLKKPFPVGIDATCQNYDTICCSAGKIGYQVELSVGDLGKMVRLTVADIL